MDSRNDRIFSLPARVYYEDTDAGGVVYHGRYINFFERARTEWLREIGFEQSELRARDNIIFAVAEAHVSYLKPARFDDLVSIEVEVEALRRVSMKMKQRIVKDGEELTRALITVVCIDADAFRARAIPEDLVATIRGRGLAP